MQNKANRRKSRERRWTVGIEREQLELHADKLQRHHDDSTLHLSQVYVYVHVCVGYVVMVLSSCVGLVCTTLERRFPHARKALSTLGIFEGCGLCLIQE